MNFLNVNIKCQYFLLAYLLIGTESNEAPEVIESTENDVDLNINYRIIGGKLADPELWQFIAAITCGRVVICGGTLLRSSWIITAGHCVHEDHIANCTQCFGKLGVKIGPEDLLNVNYKQVAVSGKSWYEKVVSVIDGNETLEIESVHIHDDFFFETVDSKTGTVDISSYDAALIKLKIPVDTLNLVNTPLVPLHKSLYCKTAGWGATSRTHLKKKGSVQKLRMIELHPIPDGTCRRNTESLLRNLNINAKDLIEKQCTSKVCCESMMPKKSVYSGDHGGPLLCDGAIQGIANYMFIYSNNEMYTSVFTNFADIIKWINTVFEEHDEPPIDSQSKICPNVFLISLTAVFLLNF